MKKATVSFYKSKLQTIIFGLFFLFVSIPSICESAPVSGDYILCFDSSISLRQFRPDIVPSLWINDFLDDIPDDSNLIIVSFSDGINIVTKIEAAKFNNGTSKIPSIPLDGLVTDFAAPLQYLVDYESDISFAAIISDGEPEIWDEFRYHLSKTVQKNPAYAQLNKQYKQLSDQGVSKKELYSKLNKQYAARNSELIQENIAYLDKKLGNALVFVDLHGKLPFLKKWTVDEKSQYIDAAAQEQPVKIKKIIIPLLESVKEKITMAEPIVPPIPDTSKTEQAAPPPVKMVVEKVTTAVVAAPPQTIEVEVYKTDYTITIIGILITAFILIGILFTREKKSQNDSNEMRADFAKKQRDLLADIGSEKKLQQDLASAEKKLVELQNNISEKEEIKSSLEQEVTAVEEQLNNDKNSIDDKLKTFEKEQRAKIEDELELYSKKEREGLQEDLTQTSANRLAELDSEISASRESRMAEIDQEALAKQKVYSEEITALLETETKKVELDIEKKKDVEQNKLTEWVRQQSQEQKEALKQDLTKMEQESQDRIQQWEEDAEQRTFSLLETKYQQTVAEHRKDIKQLSNAYTLLKTTVSSMQSESDNLQGKIVDQQQHLDKLMSSQVEKLLKERRKKEDNLWQQVSIQVQLEKEDAIKRIHKWEKESKE